MPRTNRMITATVAVAATAMALLAIAAVPVLSEDADDDDEQEVTVKWADVPEAVRKTFEKEAPGVRIRPWRVPASMDAGERRALQR